MGRFSVDGHDSSATCSLVLPAKTPATYPKWRLGASWTSLPQPTHHPHSSPSLCGETLQRASVVITSNFSSPLPPETSPVGALLPPLSPDCSYLAQHCTLCCQIRRKLISSLSSGPSQHTHHFLPLNNSQDFQAPSQVPTDSLALAFPSALLPLPRNLTSSRWRAPEVNPTLFCGYLGLLPW